VKERSRYHAQREVFELFLAAARDQDRIVIIHTKGAEREALDILDGYALPRVIIHWYSGPLDVLRDMIERGFYFTVGGEVGLSEEIREIARMIPWDRLLTETDNPGGPESYLGRPGTPALILDIVKSLAEVRKVPAGELAVAIRSNLANLFHGDSRLAGYFDRIISEE
jgi:TatD DNase family protein